MEMINNMADCLILLSKTGQNDTRKRVFTCKTCKKEFSSFQALGGHRASHKKPAANEDQTPVSPKKTKTTTHECPICGLEFAMGQALGGHMRRHRNAANGGGKGQSSNISAAAPLLPVAMKKSSGGNGKRVLCLDLNLTPLENDYLKLELERMIC